MSRKYRWGGTGGPNWKPEIVDDDPRKYRVGDKLAMLAQEQVDHDKCFRDSREAATSDIRDARIARLEKELNGRVSRTVFEIVCVGSLILDAVFGFVVCLVTR